MGCTARLVCPWPSCCGGSLHETHLIINEKSKKMKTAISSVVSKVEEEQNTSGGGRDDMS